MKQVKMQHMFNKYINFRHLWFWRKF